MGMGTPNNQSRPARAISTSNCICPIDGCQRIKFLGSVFADSRMGSSAPVRTTPWPPKWIKPQFTCLVDEAPAGDGWLHEIKYDGYRMHAQMDGGQVKLLTRTGLDWSHRYRRTIEALHRRVLT